MVEKRTNFKYCVDIAERWNAFSGAQLPLPRMWPADARAGWPTPRSGPSTKHSAWPPRPPNSSTTPSDRTVANGLRHPSSGTKTAPIPLTPTLRVLGPVNKKKWAKNATKIFFPAKDVVFGILQRNSRTKSRERRRERTWELGGWRATAAPKSKSICSASMDATNCTKLPQLEGFCPGRTSCQLQHISRSHFDLIKYKRNLNS